MSKKHNIKSSGEDGNVVCGCGQYEKHSKSKACSPEKHGAPPQDVTKDGWCQCLQDRVAGVEAATQYHDHKSDNTNLIHQPMYAPQIAGKFYINQVDENFNKQQSDARCECSLMSKKNMHNLLKKQKMTCPNYDKQYHEDCPRDPPNACCASLPEETLKEYIKHVYNFPTREGVVQSSDHSINLESAGLHKYPLFLKIVCGDKLNEDYIQRNK